MEAPGPSISSTPPPAAPRDRAINVLATGTVLALLYLGRDVLVPITLAIILSLLIAPLVRRLRHMGLGRTFSVVAAVILLTVSFASVAVFIGSQFVRMAASVPQYETTIRHKIVALNDLTVGRVNALTGQAGRVINEIANKNIKTPDIGNPAAAGGDTAAHPVQVELREPPMNSIGLITRVLSSVWEPLESTGIVLVVMIFVLLEHEALRDRVIRIAGGTDVRRMTIALNDAGERLSRFFVSQFAVNVGVGAIIWAGLFAIGLPHALLWAAMAFVLRFVPYVGIWIAAALSALLAAAVEPGWTLAIEVIGLFVIAEMIAAQLVEPQLYGHTTGLSPLSVVIAAIFWTWLWGPIGLIVSTPLTMCLLVAGRNVQALHLLDILLSDAHALTMPQRFYQRALSADADEIIVNARDFLKRNSFAAYCDFVLIPALHLARLDRQAGAISDDQQAKMRTAVAAVISAIGGEGRLFRRRRRYNSVLDEANIGTFLRSQRELTSGKWQGPIQAPAGSVMICVGLGSLADDLATELLVRVLRDQKMDARHFSLADLEQPGPPGGSPQSISIVHLVSAFPSPERQQFKSIAEGVRRRLPHACIVADFLPGTLQLPQSRDPSVAGADRTANSFGEAVQVCVDWFREPRSAGADSLPA
ncbi:MAG TPA: AI-2E family transporter [Steroidobacteraceae bacterium]|nr:AI-2E family transporter [Steroidobacteraceae bacterium]